MRDKLVNIHIPKTAGTSMRFLLTKAVTEEMQASLPVIGIDHPDPGLPYFDGLAAHARRALPRLFQPGIHMLSGHFRYRDIAPVLAADRHRVLLLTTLRDPVRRTVSDYCYSMSTVHEGHRAFRRTYPSFEHYIQNMGEMNKQCDFLKPSEGASLNMTIENAVQNLDFIGLTEQFEDDVGALFDGLNVKRPPKQVSNTNPNKEQAAEIFGAYRDRLTDLLAPDIALYEALAHRRRFPRMAQAPAFT